MWPQKYVYRAIEKDELVPTTNVHSCGKPTLVVVEQAQLSYLFNVQLTFCLLHHVYLH